jgi:hypothetical protein
MFYKGYYWKRSLLKEAYLSEAFQGIQARGCSKEKPESKSSRTAVEKQVGTRGDPKIPQTIYDSVSSCSQSFATASVKIKLQIRFYYRYQVNLENPSGSQWHNNNCSTTIYICPKKNVSQMVPSTLIPEPGHLFLRQVIST